jgi:hypothetical protein
LIRLAALWAKHPARPRLGPNVAAHWERLILSRSTDESLPLLIRKSEKGVARGEVIIHDSGRELVSTDNSPASWSFLHAFSGDLPSLPHIRHALEADSIPVAMVADREMTIRSRYKCCQVATPSPNSLGWKVCHKQPVGLQGRSSIRHRPLPDLQEHFRQFLSPSNIFLVPLCLGGLGELRHLIEAINREPHGL